jgi:hypothetical protein
MRQVSPARRGRLSRYLAIGALVLTLPTVACEGILDVKDPANLTADDFEEAIPVGLVTSGIRGEFQSMLDYYVLYTGMLADEFVLAGTFPYRQEFDDRMIFDNNAGLLGDVYNPLSRSRFMADTGVVMLENAIGTDVAGITDAVLRAAAAEGTYYGGYTRLLLAESFCESAIAGGPALSSDARMADALALFVAAATQAQAAGQTDLLAAARVGQARAHLWLGDYSAASTAAAQVPVDFRYDSYYSNNSIGQKSKVVRYTWGINEVIRFTVGDGTFSGNNFERWPYFDEWVTLGLLASEPTLQSFNPAVPVAQQKKYVSGDSPIAIASGAEAELIIAEARLRANDLGGAATIVNHLRLDNWGLAPIAFTGVLVDDLRTMARERSRELWLTGERLATLRRYLDDGLDLFSDRNGTDTCLPVPLQEKAANPNIGG